MTDHNDRADSPPSIAIDGSQFFVKGGTGIASYARTLSSALRDMGCRVSVLYGRDVITSSGSEPIDIASQVFGNEAEPRHFEKLLKAARIATSAICGWQPRAQAIKIDTGDLNLTAMDSPLPYADQVLNARLVYARARIAFRAGGRLTKVSLPNDIDAAHWTGPLPVKAAQIPNIYTIHDVIPLQFPYFVIDKGGSAAKLHAAIAAEADLIITVSEASKRHIVDILKASPDRVAVTYQPCPDIKPLSREDAERLVHDIYGLKPGDYAIFVGAIEPKKNIKRLIEGFLLANTKFPLVMVGPLGWLYDADLELIESVNRAATRHTRVRNPLFTKREERICRLGFLPRKHMTALIQCARLFAFPSIYEGFGLPVLEAMKLGVPVLTSNTSSLPEVAGDAAVLVDPLNVDEIASGIRKLAEDTDLRAALIQRGLVQSDKFSDDAYAERLHLSYRSIGLSLPEPSRRIPSYVNPGM